MSNVIRLRSSREARAVPEGALDPAVLNASAKLWSTSEISPEIAVTAAIANTPQPSVGPGLRSRAWQEEENMLDQLDRRDRLRLVEFVCSFAWADLEIQPEERVYISHLIRRLDLDEEEDRQVQQWLERPPQIDGLDPTAIPAAHRRVFVEAIQGIIAADGEVSEEERDSFEIFTQLLVD